MLCILYLVSTLFCCSKTLKFYTLRSRINVPPVYFFEKKSDPPLLLGQPPHPPPPTPAYYFLDFQVSLRKKLNSVKRTLELEIQ